MEYREELAAYYKKYNAEHREKIAMYRITHREERAAYYKKWYEEHREEISIRRREKYLAKCKQKMDGIIRNNSEKPK